MSGSDVTAGEARYYDPGQVEAYINEVTNTIKTLQARLSEATRRAEEAERSVGDGQEPESASIGRALLLASEVAEKTISEADARAAEIVEAAHIEASAILAASQREADHLIDRAREAAAAHYRGGQERLLAAVHAFVEGANMLRHQLAEVEEDVTRGREPAPVATPAPPAPDPQTRAEILGGIHNRAGSNGVRPPPPEGGTDAPPDAIRVTPISPPPPIAGFSDRRPRGDR